MAKIIKYHMKTISEDGTEIQGAAVSMPYSEANMAIAEAEAFGEVAVTDDGTPEPEHPVSTEDRLTAIETKFAAMEAAYAEGVMEA